MSDSEKKIKVFVMSSVHRWDDTRVFYRQATSLAKKYDVELHAPADFESKTVNGVKVIRLPKWKKEKDRIKLWWLLFKRAMKSDARVIHFHDPELLLIALLLRIFKRNVGLVYDVHEHILNDILDKNWIPPYLRRTIGNLYLFVEWLVVPRLDAVVYTTPIVGERYLKLAKLAISIENYPMKSIFNNSGGNRNVEGKNDVIYLGRVFYVRGVEEIIRSMPEVLETYPDARFLIVGDIVPDTYDSHLRKVTAELGLEKHVVFCGFVKYEDAKDYLSDAAAGLVTFLPYKNNMSCLPNKMFEYMASSIPVIASNFPIYGEIVESSECGVLVDPTSSKEIASAIKFYLDNKERAVEMGEKGRDAFEDRYNWEREEIRFFEFYQDIVRSKIESGNH